MKPFREEIFNGKAEQRFLRLYRKIFSIQEIEHSKALQWVFGATILSYFTAFGWWFGSRATTIDAYLAGQHTCWPYFQGCGELLFLRTLPHGYSQPFLYMVLFGLMILSVYLIHKKDWVLAHLALVPAFAWHAFVVYVLSNVHTGNFEYYLSAIGLILLFFPHKEFFLKLSLVAFYVLSVAVKIHPGWILGTYFSALKTGLPIFPDWSIPIWTNLVMFMELVGAWFLMSKNKLLQRTALVFFIIFHLYSGLLVGYRYPSTVLPSVIILFGMFYRYTKVPLDRKSMAGWVLVIVMFTLQFTSHLIPGDEKLTLEGNKYGLYMFEANHQCVSLETIHYTDGREERIERASAQARDRCDPYRFWFRMNNICRIEGDAVDRISWTFDHSINGEPFLRIVEEEDVCSLEYKATSRNFWIKTHEDNPEVIGYPVENGYY